MRILLELGHPKHVHLFRPSLRRWRERGDVVQIVTRDKDITETLLTREGISFRSLSKQQRGHKTALELVSRWSKFAGQIRQFEPDVTLSVAGITTAPPSKLFHVPNLALTDTETAVLSNRLAIPFADRVLTPAWFVADFGSKHKRYYSFHEWAYLHPREFKPDRTVVSAQGIDPDAPYAIIRLVRWDAAHDRGESGFSRAELMELAAGLSKKMRVVISAEGNLATELVPYAATFRVECVHHVLAFAQMVIGESPSMATEAALLGVPAILASSWARRCGNMQVLEERFGLMQVFERGSDAVHTGLDWAASSSEDASGRTNRRKELTQQLECVPDVIEQHIGQLVHARSR